MLDRRTVTSKERRLSGPRSAEGMEVRQCLRGDPPSLPTRFFYDDRGSELFERITRLPEYYPTRTEESLLEKVADEIAALAKPRELVELGSGVGRKVRLLLDAFKREESLESCILFDINRRSLSESSRRLSGEYDGTEFRGVVGDFMRDLPSLGSADHRMVVFLAGTIGNLYPRQVPGFLLGIRETLRTGGWLLLGLDLVKDGRTLEAAYNDSEGVTAEFNRNMLRVVNRRMGADFPVDDFEHVVFWDPVRSWIDMRLRASRQMLVSVREAGIDLHLRRGDEIRTEISCKYTRASAGNLLEGTGFEIARWFTDPGDLFALALLRAV